MEARAGYAKQMRRFRSRTVEPVLGTLLNFLGLRKVYTRGLQQAHKHVLMAALTYNLKKYVKFISKKPSGTRKAASSLPKPDPNLPLRSQGRAAGPDGKRRSSLLKPAQAPIRHSGTQIMKINTDEFFWSGLTWSGEEYEN